MVEVSSLINLEKERIKALYMPGMRSGTFKHTLPTLFLCGC